MTLDDILQEMAKAPVDAEIKAQEQAHERFLTLFEDPDGDGVYTPTTHTIQIGDETIEMPLILIRPLWGMKSKNVKFELETDLDLSGHVSKEGESNISISTKKGLFKHSSTIKISAEFEGVEPPEGIERLRDEFNDRVSKALEKLMNA